MTKSEREAHNELIKRLDQQHVDHTEAMNQISATQTVINRLIKELVALRNS